MASKKGAQEEPVPGLGVEQSDAAYCKKRPEHNNCHMELFYVLEMRESA